MTGSERPTEVQGEAHFGAFNNDEIARMEGAIDAVCAELGIRTSDHVRRQAVATRIMRSYADGRRQPLNLVHAGLDA